VLILLYQKDNQERIIYNSVGILHELRNQNKPHVWGNAPATNVMRSYWGSAERFSSQETPSRSKTGENMVLPVPIYRLTLNGTVFLSCMLPS